MDMDRNWTKSLLIAAGDDIAMLMDDVRWKSERVARTRRIRDRKMRNLCGLPCWRLKIDPQEVWGWFAAL